MILGFILGFVAGIVATIFAGLIVYAKNLKQKFDKTQ